jgi:hypothetical protein
VKAEFGRICDRDDFVEFYCEAEELWLQYADWNEKIPAVFGSFKNAVIGFRVRSSESATGFRPPPE